MHDLCISINFIIDCFCLNSKENRETWNKQEVVKIGFTLDFSKQFESHLDSISIDEL